jgi:hypothetical protein
MFFTRFAARKHSQTIAIESFITSYSHKPKDEAVSSNQSSRQIPARDKTC